MKKIIDCETGEVIERELTDEEIAQREIDNTESAARAEAIAAATEARAEAKAAAEAKLATLGLTVEDLQALGL
jgi:hypothetical protein